MKRSRGSFGACRNYWVAALVLIGAGTAWADDCPIVKTGFTGDINMVYSNDYGGGGGDSGPGGDTGGDTGGDAGAGAGEGKVLGALMTVARLSDGNTLGSALTDNETGLVTIRVCQGDLPVLVTLSGQAGAKYFDEATGRLTDFGAGNVLHALIDSFSENIAVSSLTEAAYRYALNNEILNPQDVRSGIVPLASTGNVVGLSLAQVSKVNDVVLTEINRLQTANMQLASIKSLPTPIDGTSTVSALPVNRYGIAAAVLGGLVKMGANYGTSSQNPAIEVGEQLARDLTDGKIDGFALDGQPAAGVGIPVAYDLIRLPIAASVGANDISARFGAATTLVRATPVSEQTFAGPSTTMFCTGGGDATSLMRDASITVTRTACSGSRTVIENFATQVALVEGSGVRAAGRTFFVKTDGNVWGWGDTLCGLLGNGNAAVGYESEPVPVKGMGRVTSLANGVWFTVARDDTGSVYTWGLNYIGELGLGAVPPGSVSCENDYSSPDFKFERSVTVPTKIAGLTDIVSVAADGYSPIALDKNGNLFQWGLIPTNWDFSKPQAGYHGDYMTQPIPAIRTGLPKAIAVAASYAMKIALIADGKLWGWGPNVVGNFGDGTLTPHLDPTPVPGLADVVEIASSGDSPFVALLKDGTVRYWGGCCLQSNQTIPANIERTPTQPSPGATVFYSPSTGNFLGTLPPIRHIQGSGGQVLLYGSDGTLLQFPKSQQDNTFVVLSAPAVTYQGLWWNSPAGSESGWGVNLAHQGDIIFATWFTYDAAGKPWWLSMKATKTGPAVYSGTLYETHGPPFNAVPFNPEAVSASAVGAGKLAFHDAHNGTFQYTVNGITQTKAITRELFGPLPVCMFGAQADVDGTGNYQDLWWASPEGSESGWGVNLTHQGDVIFATWFTYDTDGSPLWLSGAATKSGERAYFGPLYKTTGSAFSAVPFEPSRVTATSVGTFALQFTPGGTAGQFTYTANGTTQKKSIVREVFASPVTVCH